MKNTEKIIRDTIKKVLNIILFQIGYESSKEITLPWTQDYKDGYVDGLKRSMELINETYE